MTKIEVLAKYLDADLEDLTESDYSKNLFELGDQEYLVLTDEEADEAAKEYIRESLWAFNTDFILSHSKIDSTDRIEKAFAKMQHDLCEDANEIVFAVLEDFDDFVEDAVMSDGRGHFLSSYDGEEIELHISNEWYYIYRVN